jgi:hypothetical protein
MNGKTVGSASEKMFRNRAPKAVIIAVNRMVTRLSFIDSMRFAIALI